MEMKLADWLIKYKPNVVNLGCLPGGEEDYIKVQGVIKTTLPGTPIRVIQVVRETHSDSVIRIKIVFHEGNITRDQLFLSDLTLLVNENGVLIPIRTTNASPSGIKFTL